MFYILDRYIEFYILYNIGAHRGRAIGRWVLCKEFDFLFPLLFVLALFRSVSLSCSLFLSLVVVVSGLSFFASCGWK